MPGSGVNPVHLMLPEDSSIFVLEVLPNFLDCVVGDFLHEDEAFTTVEHS